MPDDTPEPLTSIECPACGETTYFYKVDRIECECGEVVFELSVKTHIKNLPNGGYHA